MITGAIMSWLASLFGFLIGTIPEIDLPNSIAGTEDGSVYWLISTAVEWSLGMSTWIPLGTLFTAFMLVVYATYAAIAIKLLRMVLSLFTGGGGNAAS